jgi:hypothetical protein
VLTVLPQRATSICVLLDGALELQNTVFYWDYDERFKPTTL